MYKITFKEPTSDDYYQCVYANLWKWAPPRKVLGLFNVHGKWDHMATEFVGVSPNRKQRKDAKRTLERLADRMERDPYYWEREVEEIR